jgi:ATP-dependent DNA helicase RecG
MTNWATAPQGRPNRRLELLTALGDQERTRAEIMRETDLTARIVSHWLRILRRERLVEPVGEPIRSPNVRYRRTRQQILDDTAEYRTE